MRVKEGDKLEGKLTGIIYTVIGLPRGGEYCHIQWEADHEGGTRESIEPTNVVERGNAYKKVNDFHTHKQNLNI